MQMSIKFGCSVLNNVVLPAAYIAIGLVPFEWACRHSVDSLVIQAFPRLNQQKYVMARKVVEAFAVYGVSLGIALAIPGDSAKIIAVTGVPINLSLSHLRCHCHSIKDIRMLCFFIR